VIVSRLRGARAWQWAQAEKRNPGADGEDCAIVLDRLDDCVVARRGGWEERVGRWGLPTCGPRAGSTLSSVFEVDLRERRAASGSLPY
jgi:hypothetical protein